MTDQDKRSPWRAMAHGWRGRCPRCGQGAMFNGYLTVRACCDQCGQDLTHQQADDGPAYLTIFIVGHVALAPILPIYRIWDDPDPVLLISGLSAACIVSALYLLPRIKGAFIGLQWAKAMHGF